MTQFLWTQFWLVLFLAVGNFTFVQSQEMPFATTPSISIEFDSRFSLIADVRKEAGRAVLKGRLMAFGVIAGGFLALLGVFFAYLRLDHATRGFYSGRLQGIAGITAVTILAICYLLWTQVLFK